MQMDDGVAMVAIILIAAILLIILAVRLLLWLQWFHRELRYLDKEIARTEGEEKKVWISRKKRLWLSILPFYRK